MVHDFDRYKSMYKIICAKLSGNKEIAKILVSTKGEITFPESDSFWGTNDGLGGKNKLGLIFMDIRSRLV